MTPKERMTFIGLLIFITLFGGGFVAYIFFLQPIQEADQQIANMEGDVQKLEDKLSDIEFGMARYEILRKMSLPMTKDDNPFNFAQSEYSVLLDRMLRQSSFVPETIKIKPLAPESRNSPNVEPKKPAYHRLPFKVEVTGDLLSWIEFMELFYKQPLLHQIRDFDVAPKGGSSGRRGNTNELSIKMTIDALVLDKADNRYTLDPVPNAFPLLGGGGMSFAAGTYGNQLGKGSPYPFDKYLLLLGKNAPLLIEQMFPGNRVYAAITGKNFFFGPPPEKKEEVKTKPKEPDLAPYIKLVSLAEAPGKLTATFFDIYNKYDYVITQKSDGTISAESFWYTNDKKKSFWKGKYLTYGDVETGNFKQYRIVKITHSDILLQEVDEDREKRIQTGGAILGGNLVSKVLIEKTYTLHIGSTVKEMTPLLSRHAREELLGNSENTGSPKRSGGL
jgi:hypothetical protein